MKKLLALAALLSTLAFTACNADKAKEKVNAGPVTDDEKTLYAIGFVLGKQIENFDLKTEEIAQVQKGFADAAAKAKPVADPQEYMTKIQAMQMARMQAASDKAMAETNAYIDKVAKDTGATKT